MITDRDNERRDGYSSSNRPSIRKNVQSGDQIEKKKRKRVGDTRQALSSDRSKSDTNFNNYRTTEERRPNSSYNNDSYYSNNNRDSYNQDSYNRTDRNNDRRKPSFNRSSSSEPTNNTVSNNRTISRSSSKKLVKPVKYKENIDPETEIRLNKYLANAGVCSRREADTLITSGAIKVNGEVVSELGAKVKRSDTVTHNELSIRLESKVYVLLNKPKNTVTTSDDPQNRKTVMDLVKGACPERIYPVGRLDRNTTGVLLLTNDGDLASKLMHPKYKKKKIYQVKLDRDVAMEDMQAIADGIMLDDGEIHADSIAYVGEDVLNEVGIEIHSGRNRIVRRIFEKLGYQILKLDRVYFAGLTKKNLPRGRWRYLTETEVNMLRMGAFE